jgi:hypothetical protein
MEIVTVKCTDEVRNRIWNSKFGLRASLYLLSLEKEKAFARSDEEKTDYGVRLRQPDFFSKKDLGEIHKELVISKKNTKLKPLTYIWMEKYTSNQEFAQTLASFTMSLMIYIKGKIVQEPFHTNKMKQYGNVIKSFQELFIGSQFENVLDIMLCMLQVKNQGVNAKTQENKMLDNDNTRILDDKLTLFLQNKENAVRKEPSSSGQIKVDNDDDLKQNPNPSSSSTSIKGKKDESQTGTNEEQKLSNNDSSNIPKLESSIKSKLDNDDSKEKCQEEDEKIAQNDASSSTSIKAKNDGSRTVSKEEQKLLHKLRKIPDSDVEKCFEMDKNIFHVRLDEAVEEKKNLLRYLQKVNAKYQKWKDKESPTTLPELVSIPSQVLQKWFQYRLEHENVLFQVRKIEGDGNCLYRSLSQYMIQKQ